MSGKRPNGPIANLGAFWIRVYMKLIISQKFSAVVLSFLLIISWPFNVAANGDGGLVPCEGPDCDFDDLVALVKAIINFIITLAIVGSAIMFAWAGFIYITAGGSQEKVKQAHNLFKYVGLGLVIILAAWLIVDLILEALTGDGLQDWGPGSGSGE